MAKTLNTLGRKIRTLRQFKDVSKNIMAEKLKLSLEDYDRIENEEAKLSEAQLKQIARLLDINVADIENFEDKVIFNVHVHDQATGGIYSQHHHHTDTKIIELLEDKVKLLEDKLVSKVEKITALEDEITRLKEKYKDVNM